MNATKARTRVAVVALAALGLIAGPLVGTAAAQNEVVVSDGHVDLFYVDVQNSAHVLTAHTGSGNVAPGDLTVHAKPSVASRTVSASIATLPGWKAQGETYYVLPQNSQPGQVFAGFGYSSAVADGTSVTYTLDSLQGPGAFALWQNGEEGPNVFLASAEGGPKSFTSAADHEHGNWGFTELGEYALTVSATATPPGGTPVTIPPVTYTVFVGEELSSGPETPATQLSITGLSAHYHAGGVAALTAVQNPVTDENHYHWFTKAAGATEWSVVSGALTGKYGFVVRTADNGRQVKAVLYNHDHAVIAESEPAVIVVDDHGNDPVNGPAITTTLSAEEGVLAISVAPENREVDLGALTLNPAADRFTAAGALKPITVTDTRADNPGWTASGRVRAFTTVDGGQLGGKYLGWTPNVLSASAGQTVTAGPQVASGFATGNGLATWSQLATASAGAGRGTAQLGAGLTLEAPVETAPGAYQAMLILTAI